MRPCPIIIKIFVSYLAMVKLLSVSRRVIVSEGLQRIPVTLHTHLLTSNTWGRLANIPLNRYQIWCLLTVFILTFGHLFMHTLFQISSKFLISIYVLQSLFYIRRSNLIINTLTLTFQECYMSVPCLLIFLRPTLKRA